LVGLLDRTRGRILRPRFVVTFGPFVKKLILLSVIIASIALPARAARMADGHAGLKKALIHVVIFEFIYLLLITQVWFRM